MMDWFPVIVTQRQKEAPDIYSYVLGPSNGAGLPRFTAGSHIEVKIADSIRHYSLLNSPHDSDRFEIAILREANGRGGSIAMCDDVAVGDTLAIRGPHCNFGLVLEAAPSLLIAGGIGITPLMSMAQELWHLARPFKLHYCSRSLETTAFMQRLNLSAFAEHVSFHHDNTSQNARPDLLGILKSSSPQHHLYVCGPGAMIDATVRLADQLGWKASHIHVERFAAANGSNDANQPFSVTLRSTGQTILIGSDQSVMQALREIGIRIDFSCESGACGTCITTVLEGVPDHRDCVLTAEEHEAGRLFTPCCSRAKSDVLVLDL